MDIIDLLRFVTFSMIMCPPNVIWQSFLEAQFPAYGNEFTTSEKERSKDKVLPKRLNIKNTATKFALDQTIGAAVNVRILLFVINYLTGH